MNSYFKHFVDNLNQSFLFNVKKNAEALRRREKKINYKSLRLRVSAPLRLFFINGVPVEILRAQKFFKC